MGYHEFLFMRFVIEIVQELSQKNEKVATLGLASFLVMPVQRLPRYNLLLRVREFVRLFLPAHHCVHSKQQSYHGEL